MSSGRVGMVASQMRFGAVVDPPQTLGETFGSFFEREHADLFRALWLMTRDRHEAEELMQDAFLKVWEGWDAVAAMEAPGGYLYRTAMNLFRSRRRRAASAVRKTLRLVPRDRGVTDVDERDAVVRALAALTPAERAAVVLTDLLDLTSEQAGESLGIAPSTVRVLVSRGRARLRERLGERDD